MIVLVRLSDAAAGKTLQLLRCCCCCFVTSCRPSCCICFIIKKLLKPATARPTKVHISHKRPSERMADARRECLDASTVAATSPATINACAAAVAAAGQTEQRRRSTNTTSAAGSRETSFDRCEFAELPASWNSWYGRNGEWMEPIFTDVDLTTSKKRNQISSHRQIEYRRLGKIFSYLSKLTWVKSSWARVNNKQRPLFNNNIFSVWCAL